MFKEHKKQGTRNDSTLKQATYVKLTSFFKEKLFLHFHNSEKGTLVVQRMTLLRNNLLSSKQTSHKSGQTE